MFRPILITTLLAATLPVVFAQSPEGSQTITGLLMDASCSAIGGGGRTASRMKARTEARQQDGPKDKTAVDRSERDAANNPGTNGPDNAAVKRSEEAVSSTATAGPSQASATGTTGAAVSEAPPPRSGNLESLKSVQDEHSRDNSATSGGSTSVREKYKACVVTSSTTGFAIHTEGRIYVLDQASNQMVQDQMRNEAFRASMSDRAGAARFMTVTVMAKPATGDRLSITSVRK